MATGFVDTNVLIYAHDVDDPRRQAVALKVLAMLTRDRTAAVSTHVLGEYVSVSL